MPKKYMYRTNCNICEKKMAIDIANTCVDSIEICKKCLENEVPRLIVFNRPGMPVPWGRSGGGAVAFLNGKKIACTEAIWRATARGARLVDFGRCSKAEFAEKVSAYLSAS
jgi:hypothetical protein